MNNTIIKETVIPENLTVRVGDLSIVHNSKIGKGTRVYIDGVEQDKLAALTLTINAKADQLIVLQMERYV
jgi:hypothetical protein